MWFKQGMSLDDLNFDMENSSSLVDVKLLLKRILDSYWNKRLFKFCVTVCRLQDRVQNSTCKKCNGGGNSEIGYATDCLYSFWDRQKAEFCVPWLCTFFPPAINFCRSEEKFSQVYWAIIVTQCTDL